MTTGSTMRATGFGLLLLAGLCTGANATQIDTRKDQPIAQTIEAQAIGATVASPAKALNPLAALKLPSLTIDKLRKAIVGETKGLGKGETEVSPVMAKPDAPLDTPKDKATGAVRGAPSVNGLRPNERQA